MYHFPVCGLCPCSVPADVAMSSSALSSSVDCVVTILRGHYAEPQRHAPADRRRRSQRPAWRRRRRRRAVRPDTVSAAGGRRLNRHRLSAGWRRARSTRSSHHVHRHLGGQCVVPARRIRRRTSVSRGGGGRMLSVYWLALRFSAVEIAGGDIRGLARYQQPPHLSKSLTSDGARRTRPLATERGGGTLSLSAGWRPRQRPDAAVHLALSTTASGRQRLRGVAGRLQPSPDACRPDAARADVRRRTLVDARAACPVSGGVRAVRVAGHWTFGTRTCAYALLVSNLVILEDVVRCSRCRHFVEATRRRHCASTVNKINTVRTVLQCRIQIHFTGRRSIFLRTEYEHSSFSEDGLKTASTAFVRFFLARFGRRSIEKTVPESRLPLERASMVVLEDLIHVTVIAVYRYIAINRTYSTVALVPPMSTMDVWRGIT